MPQPSGFPFKLTIGAATAQCWACGGEEFLADSADKRPSRIVCVKCGQTNSYSFLLEQVSKAVTRRATAVVAKSRRIKSTARAAIGTERRRRR